MEGVHCVFDYEVTSTASEVKIPMKCTPLLHGGCGHPSGDLLLNLQEAPKLKGNCLYGVSFKTVYLLKWCLVFAKAILTTVYP